MLALGYLILGLYLLALTIVLVYCLMQFHLLYHYRKNLTKTTTLPHVAESELPFVTIQLPIYNEYYVVERLIDNIMLLDYPKSKLEVHVLDDSTDETRQLIAGKVAKNTMPYFADEKVGVVQTRWEHINENYSLLTRLQAFQLNVHFTVEQKGRQNGEYLLQFNGTAGVWRRETIETAGGWEADTLTEDLDLSYRAQLIGWKIVYREEIGSPAELPAEMQGLKSQQYRWMKGGAETARKMLPTVWKADLPIAKKLHASVHLLGSSVFLSVFMLGVLSVPVLFLLNPLGLDKSYLGIFLISLLTIIIVYYIANVEQEWKTENKGWLVVKFILIFPVFLALSMGLSLHNSVAVVQGYLGRKSAFIRTPKFDITSMSDTWKAKKYHKYKVSAVTVLEGLLSLYFIGGIAAGLYTGEHVFLVLHVLLTFGYGATFFLSLRHLKA